MYSALVSTPANSVSSETPFQTVSSFDHLVTQWTSTVIVSLGNAWNSAHVHESGFSGGRTRRAAPAPDRRRRGACPGSRARWPSGVLPELSAEHPLLLLELAHDLDQDVLGSEIGVAKAVHQITNWLAALGDPVRQLAHDQVILEGGRSDGGQLRPGRDRLRLTVGDESESAGPLRDG